MVTEDSERVSTALGGTALVTALSTLDSGSCTERAAALRRRLMAVEQLYEGVPAQVRAPGSVPETLPLATEPPGEEFARFEYDAVMGLSKDGEASPTPADLAGTASVLLRADRHAPGAALRDTLRGLRDAGVERVGLLYSRPIAEALERGSPDGVVFGDRCPVDWSLVDKVPQARKAEIWIETAVRAVEDCDCAADLRGVVAMRDDRRNAARAIAIPVDVRGKAGDRPLVIRDGGTWGPAAVALYNAVRIDPKRPRGTPVVLDLEAAAPNYGFEVRRD